MALFTWNRDHCVGIEALDRQHIEFFDIMNGLYEAFRSGQSRYETGPALDRLVCFARQHLAAEEQLMESTGYPGLSNYRNRYQALVVSLSRLMKCHEGGGDRIPIDLLIFLGDWLADHIEREDKAYAPWLMQHGVK